jgi:hypothetical protein
VFFTSVPNGIDHVLFVSSEEGVAVDKPRMLDYASKRKAKEPHWGWRMFFS